VKAFLLDNLNALTGLIGFCVFEAGIGIVWGRGIACIVAGVVLMVTGSWPFLVLTLRKRQG